MAPKILNPLADDLYEFNGPARVLGMDMGHRMVVVRLGPESGGGLWIHSPVAWSPELQAELDELAPTDAPRHLIIPSRTHDLHLEPWLERIPAETTYAPAALQKVHPDWQIGQTLADQYVAPWSGELRHQGLRGAPRVSEVDFLHLPSKTLILTDCVFNLTGPRSLLGGLLLWLNACQQGICTTRIFRMTIKDQRAFGASIASMLGWDFERVLVGHGDVIEADGVPALREHLEAFLEGFAVG
jgi:hypothetical protein